MIIPLRSLLYLAIPVSLGEAASVTVSTTSGALQGIDQDGVMSFKGIRYGQSPTEDRRWQPPLAFESTDTLDATKLGPSCIQQFEFATANFSRALFNNPPPPEDEDCLFLNVWAPSASDGDFNSAELKPTVVWIHGGALEFGTASLPLYDGTSMSSNQNIVVVTINYRTNVFGFPAASDLPVEGNNLGFLDQDLALDWVQRNIEKFGGDPRRVTIMGQSAGGLSVSTAVVRHRDEPPFAATVMLSGNLGALGATPNAFDEFAAAVDCTDTPGDARLACLRDVPADRISEYVNGPSSGAFGSVTLDNVTAFDKPIDRILAGQTARVPVLMGNTQDDGSLAVVGMTNVNLTEFLASRFGGEGVPLEELEQRVRGVYPGMNDTQIIASAARDLVFQCPAALWSGAVVASGVGDVYRYIYGAVFADMQVVPGLGAYHASELPILFGTYNRTTATPDEVTLSATFQTAIANFIKNPNASPAPQWAKYEGRDVAKLAYEGNVESENVVQVVLNSTVDGPCELWNLILGSL